MTYEYTGKIVWVSDSEECTGKFKRKVNIVIHTDDNRDLYMTIFDDNIEKFLGPVELNDKVSGQFSVKSIQYGQKWYTNLFCLTMEKVERKKREHRQRTHTHSTNRTYWFDGCKTPAEVKKRYRELCKQYHPDTGTGDVKKMQEINVQYNRMK